MQCAAHPQVETELQCGRCEKPICPKCLVQTPVGARCKECAQLRRAPMYELTPGHYATAVLGAAAVAVGGGLAWTLVTLAVPYMGFFIFFLAIGFGYAAGQVMDRLTRGKRGTVVQVLGVAGVVGAYLVRNALLAGNPLDPVLAGGDFAGYLAVIVAAAVTFNNLR